MLTALVRSDTDAAEDMHAGQWPRSSNQTPIWRTYYGLAKTDFARIKPRECHRFDVALSITTESPHRLCP